MKMNDFAWHLSSFLVRYLLGEKNMSRNTIASYRDTFRLFLLFCEKEKKISPDRMTLSSLTRKLTLEYLDWLEQKRKCSVATRNQRLSSIHCFLRYVQSRLPENLFEIKRVLQIPPKKSPKAIVSYLTEEELKILFRQPDVKTRKGRRDLMLLTLMYDSAARVSELIDLKVEDVRLVSPAVVTLTGKGGKARQVPILGKTKDLLSGYLEEHKKYPLPVTISGTPLFCNQRHQKLTRWGVSYILDKYVTAAKKDTGFNVNFRVTPHVLRHAKAMGMLKAGINLIYIRDFLGHSNIATTEIYARADSEMKRKALEKTYKDLYTGKMPKWEEDKDLMQWLYDLCR
ncbi:MAG: integrase [Actinobacteria bacterium]|nr:integrase [Actinomycetota bacterium]